MGMNDTPSSERIHIGFFGCRNAGKSSLINAVTGQKLSIVSDVKGTTTDPVYKSMELLPAGPVTIIDTPGLDDEGALGELRIAKGMEALRKTDVAVLVVDAAIGKSPADDDLLRRMEAQNTPYLLVYNKVDDPNAAPALREGEMAISAQNGWHVSELKERIAALAKNEGNGRPLTEDLVSPLDIVVLVVPIDKAAPKGRLILPQQQVIRDLLERGAIPVVVRECELAATLEKLKCQVKLVITDSQAFALVSQTVPENTPLTSFSILFARYKGDLPTQVAGANAFARLQNGDKVLIAEGCTHHRQCGDIGTMKLPAWLNAYSGKKLDYVFTSGREFPDDLSPFAVCIHCGGCMLNEREMRYRLLHAKEAGLPITNYGIAIAKMQGILDRALAGVAFRQSI